MEHLLVPVHQHQVEPPPRYRDHDSESFDDMQAGGLLEYWRIIRRRKGMVALIASLCVLIAVFATLAQAPLYRARVSIEIEDTRPDFTKQMSPVADTGITALNDIQTQITILKSEALRDRTLSKLAASSAGLAESTISRFRRAINPVKVPASRARELVLEACARSLDVHVTSQTRIIELVAYATDSKIAAAFANTLTSEYIEQNIQARSQMKQLTSDWLGRQLEEMRMKLERSENTMQSYARQNNLIFTKDKQDGRDREDIAEQKLYQLQEELSLAEADRVQSQSRYETARTTRPEILSDMAYSSSANLREPRSNPLLTYKAALQIKLADLRAQEAELTAGSKPDDSRGKQVRAEIATVEEALAREQKAILDRIQNTYQESLRREELLASAYAAQVGLVARDSEKSIQYNILRREVDSNRLLFEAMLQGVKESTVASALKASNVRIIDSAKVPENPYRPSWAFNCALGLFAGLMLGMGYVVTRANGNRTIQEPGEASHLLHLPELGVIPSASVDKRIVFWLGRKRGARSSASLLPSSGTAIPGHESKLSTPRLPLTTWQTNASMVSEGFRSVTASIVSAGHNGSRPRVLAITSVGPMEGKTTTASNLAIGFAKIGQKVLLIDGDLRKPSLHEIFETDNSSGFVDLLKQNHLDDDTARTLICKTPIPNLYLLPGGRSVGAGADLDLPFSACLPGLIARYKKEYDIVIIDTPPMLQIPDARLLGRISDAVVLVLRAGLTSLDAAMAVRERLAEDGTRVLGVVLNDWDPKSSYGYGRMR